MSTFVPLGSAECAMDVPLGSIEWHAPEAIREEGRPRTTARWPWATLKPWLSRPSRQAYAFPAGLRLDPPVAPRATDTL